VGKMYDRNYRDATQMRVGAGSTVMSQVLGLLGFSFVFTALGGLIGINVGPAGYSLGLIASLVFLVALMLLKDHAPLNLTLMYAFATADGLVLGGILEDYVQAGLGGAIVDAAGTTAVVTLVASVYGITTKCDLRGLSGILTIGLLALLGALIVGLFVQMTALQLVVAVVGALLFTAFITVDMQRVARTPAASGGDAILMAVSVYLDIVNLFLYLLQLFGMGRRSRG